MNQFNAPLRWRSAPQPDSGLGLSAQRKRSPCLAWLSLAGRKEGRAPGVSLRYAVRPLGHSSFRRPRGSAGGSHPRIERKRDARDRQGPTAPFFRGFTRIGTVRADRPCCCPRIALLRSASPASSLQQTATPACAEAAETISIASCLPMSSISGRQTPPPPRRPRLPSLRA
jgi:hypothetical protein